MKKQSATTKAPLVAATKPPKPPAGKDSRVATANSFLYGPKVSLGWEGSGWQSVAMLDISFSWRWVAMGRNDWVAVLAVWVAVGRNRS